MNKYELRIVSINDGTLEVLMQAFMYATNEHTATIMADNIFKTYQENSNYSEFYKGIIVQRQFNLVG